MVLGREVEPFIVGYATSVDLKDGSAVIPLRRYVTDQLIRRRDSPRDSQLKALCCVRAFVLGTRIEKLVASEDGYEMLLEREAARSEGRR